MKGLGIGPERIVACLATYDYSLLVAAGLRSVLEEFPASLHLAFQDNAPTFDRDQLKEGFKAPARLGQLFGLNCGVPIIGMPHHDNHAWFPYLASPFARERQQTMIVVVDGSGDFASTTLYLGENGVVRQIRSNASMFNSLGLFYAMISSTQGGWTRSAAKAATWAPRPMATWTVRPTLSIGSCETSLIFGRTATCISTGRLRIGLGACFVSPIPRISPRSLARPSRLRRCGIPMRSCVSKTSITGRIRRKGSTRLRPPRWFSRMVSSTSLTV